MISNNNLTGNNAQGQPAPEAGDAARRRKRILLYCAAGVLVVAIAVVAWLVFSHMAEQKAKEQAEIEAEARNLDLQQQLADSEFENLENDFRQLETQRVNITNDTLKSALPRSTRLRVCKSKTYRRSSKTSAVARPRKYRICAAK